MVIYIQVELCIWDTAGQERFHAIQPLYYRDADAVRSHMSFYTDVICYGRLCPLRTKPKAIFTGTPCI